MSCDILQMGGDLVISCAWSFDASWSSVNNQQELPVSQEAERTVSAQTDLYQLSQPVHSFFSIWAAPQPHGTSSGFLKAPRSLPPQRYCIYFQGERFMRFEEKSEYVVLISRLCFSASSPWSALSLRDAP